MQKDYLQNSGYKKSGKVYTPPILQLGEFTEIHWNNNILPELLWIGILQNKFGFNHPLKMGVVDAVILNKNSSAHS